MASDINSQKYVAVSEDAEDGHYGLMRRGEPRWYKPTAIKTPTLLLFAAILAVCIASIEIIFHQSSRPDYMISVGENAQTSASLRTRGILARAANTTTPASTHATSDNAGSSGLQSPSTSLTTSVAAKSSAATSILSKTSAPAVPSTTYTIIVTITDPAAYLTLATQTQTQTGNTVTIYTLVTPPGKTSTQNQQGMSSYTTASSAYIALSSSEATSVTSQPTISTITTKAAVTTTPQFTGTIIISVSDLSAYVSLTANQSPQTGHTVTVYSYAGTTSAKSQQMSPTVTSDLAAAATTSERTITVITPVSDLSAYVSLTAHEPSQTGLIVTVYSYAGTTSARSQSIPLVTESSGDTPSSQATMTISVTGSYLTLTTQTGPTTGSTVRVTVYVPASSVAMPTTTKSDTLPAVTRTATNSLVTPTASTIPGASKSQSPAVSTGTQDTWTSDSPITIFSSAFTTTSNFLTLTSSDKSRSADLTSSNAQHSPSQSGWSTTSSLTDDAIGTQTSALPSITVSSTLSAITVSSTLSAITLSSVLPTITISSALPTITVVSNPSRSTIDTWVSVDSTSSSQSTVFISSSTMSTVKPWIVQSSVTTGIGDSQTVSTFAAQSGSGTIASLAVSFSPTSSTSEYGTTSSYTIATRYTSLIRTTDAAGLSTSFSVIVVVETALSTSPTPLTTEPSETGSATFYTATTRYTSLIATTDKAGHTTSIPIVITQETILSTSPASPTVPASSTALENGTTTVYLLPTATLAADEVVVGSHSIVFRYVAALFLPPIIAIIIKVFWEIIFSSFKMMEPFQRLRSSVGVSAERGLFTNYLSNSALVSWEAIRFCLEGRILTLSTTLTYIIVITLASLTSASMTVRATQYCETESGTTMRCNPVWVVETKVLRCIEGLLAACIILTFIVIFFSWRLKTGVVSNPSSIISLAVLFNHEPLLRDFRHVDCDADESMLLTSLSRRRYRLEYYSDAQGRSRYGITRDSKSTFSGEIPDTEKSRLSIKKWLNGYSKVSNPTTPSHTIPAGFLARLSPPTQSAILDGVQFLTTGALFAMVVAYFFDTKSDPFNNFFNSGGFGARLTFVAIATIVDMQWKRLEREVRIIEPYRRMAKGFARPEVTVLMRLNGTCWSELPGSVYRMFRYRHMWFQALVSFVTVLSDFNIIAVANLVYSDVMTTVAVRVAGYISIITTGLMMTVMLLTLLWWRRTIVKQMPIAPYTIGGVLFYLCGSHMTQILSSAHLEHLDERERNERILASEWRFCFGKRDGPDGRERWCVDRVGRDGSKGTAERTQYR